ncbi:MAG TPA: GNAT family N-acetyltransferase [Anaerolineales bacterium]|nr:GNAT family N-acetyltransferase [Anaerolineales bacterium]
MTAQPSAAEVDRSAVRIRPVVAQDLPALEWEGQYRHYRRVFQANFDDMRRGQRMMWVAESEGRLVGQVFVQLLSADPNFADGVRRAYLYAFRVRPGWQGQGLGTRLMAAAEEDLVARGFRLAVIAAGRDNLRARTLYERLGYRVFAEDPGDWTYTDDQGQLIRAAEPAWLMQKPLPARG